MNDFNQNSNLKPQKQGQESVSGFWTSLIHSIWGDPFSILKSPLFIVMTALIVTITFLLVYYTQNLEISILTGLILELLTAVLTWQFLSLSRRLDSISTRTSDLQYSTQLSERAHKESFNELNLGFDKSQRSLGKMDEVLSRIFDSDKEMKDAVTLFCENLVEFYDRVGDWRSQQNTDTQKIALVLKNLRSLVVDDQELLRKDIMESGQKTVSSISDILKTQIALLSESQLNTIEHLTEDQKLLREDIKESAQNSESNISDILKTQIALLSESQLNTIEHLTEDQKLLREDIMESGQKTASTINDILKAQIAIEKSIQGNKLLEAKLSGQMQEKLNQANKNLLQTIPEKTAQLVDELTGTGFPRPLEVSTALDRLNLELRRQLVEMRLLLKQPNQSIQ